MVHIAATSTLYGPGLLGLSDNVTFIFSADLLTFVQYFLKPWRQTMPLLQQDQENQENNINYVFNASRVQAVF